VSDLGEVLERLHSARQSWTTVHAQVREWSHRERRTQAFLRAAQRRPGGILSARGTEPHEHNPPIPDETEWTARVWVAPPDRVRVDYEGDSVVPVRRRVSSVNGAPAVVTTENPMRHLLDPSALPGLLDLRLTGRDEMGGRPVWIVEGRPRDGLDGMLRPLAAVPVGGDRYELAVDVERGVVLRIEAQLDGQPFSITEVTAIQFDVPVDDSVFVSVPPDPAIPRPERVSIEEAARRAPFTVFVPTRVPADSTLWVRFVPAHEHRPATVVLSYHLPGALHHLTVIECAEPAAGPRPRAGPDNRIVTVVRAGTSITLTSDLGADPLQAVADSLVPAPTEPPGV
jgi:hypothetical protein